MLEVGGWMLDVGCFALKFGVGNKPDNSPDFEF